MHPADDIDDPRADAIAHLPAAHSLALRMRDARVPDLLIAECLHIEPESLGPLLEVAEAKLATILGSEPSSPLLVTPPRGGPTVGAAHRIREERP